MITIRNFTPAGRPLPALRSLDLADRVLYVGSFSKSLFPSLRLGYIVCPAALRDALYKAKLLDDLGSPSVEQAALATFIQSRQYEKHLRKSVKELIIAGRTVIDALQRLAGSQIEIGPHQAGMHFVVWFRHLDFDRAQRIPRARHNRWALACIRFTLTTAPACAARASHRLCRTFRRPAENRGRTLRPLLGRRHAALASRSVSASRRPERGPGSSRCITSYYKIYIYDIMKHEANCLHGRRTRRPVFRDFVQEGAARCAEVEIFERNRPDDTFGWGVVFSDKTMGNFLEADAPSHARIVDEFYHWDDIDVHFKGQIVRSGGHGFAGISRRKLLSILQKRAASLGVKQILPARARRHRRVRRRGPLWSLRRAPIARPERGRPEKFGPHIEVRKCRYIWLGTTQKFSAFTFAFEKTEFGWFQIHAYQFSKDLSTVIVETREETWAAHGLDKADADQSIAFCENLFAAYLGQRAASVQRAASARLAVAQFQSGGMPALARRQSRAHRRCRAHCALSRSDRAPSWRWRMQSRW